MPQIEVSEETLALIKEQYPSDIELVNIEELNDLIGKKLFFRTVTYFMVGKVEKIFGDFIELSGASWVADSGKFSTAIEDGELDEVELTGQHYVNLKSVVDFFPWNHKLPTKTK